MFKGIAITISACIIWGLIYVIPLFMEDFNPLEIAIGRYLCYGMVSVIYMLAFSRASLLTTPFYVWKKAFIFSFLAHVGLYPATVLSIKYADAAVAALILGMTPVTIAVIGNLKQKECSFKSLLWPCVAMMVGLIMVNYSALLETSFENSIPIYCLGLIFGFLALISWSTYAIANGRFLKRNPKLSSREWSSIMGIASGIWVMALGIGLLFFTPKAFLSKFLIWTPELQTFLVGSLVLGLACSWTGAFLWNKGSSMLPISLAGQLTIFETLFGLLFVYLIQKKIPTALEFSGIAIILIGIYSSIKIFTKAPEPVSEKVVERVKE